MGGRDGRYYTECPGQCVRCDGRNRRYAKDRCDDGIGDDHIRINLTVITQFIWRRAIYMGVMIVYSIRIN